LVASAENLRLPFHDVSPLFLRRVSSISILIRFIGHICCPSLCNLCIFLYTGVFVVNVGIYSSHLL
jgi:hypothetical protein